MSLKRIGVLLGKEFLQGPKNFIFVWAVIAPVVISFVVSLAFGSLFSEKPKLGVMDEGDSQMVAMITGLDSATTREYDTVPAITHAVESGGVDMGIVLPRGFDDAVSQGKETEVRLYIWGESLAKNRSILGVTITNLIRELAGQEAPVDIETITLGDEVSIPWNDRLLPLIVLMAVFIGGLFLPSTSVINEKVKNTMVALVVTPTTTGDIFMAKGLLGFILSLIMGIIILLLNQAFGSQPALLVMVLALGGIMATEIGLILGALIKDITSLFAIWKLGGILLFAPALIYMFPQIPEWVGMIFPTYYVVQPIVQISQQVSTWADIAINIFVLIGLDVLFAGIVVLVLRRRRVYLV